MLGTLSAVAEELVCMAGVDAEGMVVSKLHLECTRRVSIHLTGLVDGNEIGEDTTEGVDLLD